LTFRQRKKKIIFIPAVCKFGDVHPAKLSRLPPNEIEIAPKAQLISKPLVIRLQQNLEN